MISTRTHDLCKLRYWWEFSWCRHNLNFHLLIYLLEDVTTSQTNLNIGFGMDISNVHSPKNLVPAFEWDAFTTKCQKLTYKLKFLTFFFFWGPKSIMSVGLKGILHTIIIKLVKRKCWNNDWFFRQVREEVCEGITSVGVDSPPCQGRRVREKHFNLGCVDKGAGFWVRAWHLAGVSRNHHEGGGGGARTL